ncbi:hypothetical protein Cha6605_1955 [Chamaesiphon minutus PCC 6605]|uniref:Uncharacterized protein n=1 Tax=Chamaesiphon minutus (strain ATCC 27169 / PCC 6605) TaxID=1173020 RepID=K9UD69_CHAP6|nr:hypothetical protein Cha6605_1955 [Chamaesiphon minutus PCC 6605]
MKTQAIVQSCKSTTFYFRLKIRMTYEINLFLITHFKKVMTNPFEIYFQLNLSNELRIIPSTEEEFSFSV